MEARNWEMTKEWSVSYGHLCWLWLACHCTWVYIQMKAHRDQVPINLLIWIFTAHDFLLETTEHIRKIQVACLCR